MIGYSLDELSVWNRHLPAKREVWSAAWIAVCVIGGPVMLTMASLLFFYALGMAWTEEFWAAFYVTGFVSNFILLPLSAGLAVKNRERKQEIAGEMMAFFSRKVTTLYAMAEKNPALSEDSRTAEVFEIYSLAAREVEENLQNPLGVRKTIEQGVFLADEVLATYGARQARPRLYPG